MAGVRPESPFESPTEFPGTVARSWLQTRPSSQSAAPSERTSPFFAYLIPSGMGAGCQGWRSHREAA